MDSISVKKWFMSWATLEPSCCGESRAGVATGGERFGTGPDASDTLSSSSPISSRLRLNTSSTESSSMMESSGRATFVSLSKSQKLREGLRTYVTSGARRSGRICFWLARDAVRDSGIRSTALQATCSPSTSCRDGCGSFRPVGGASSHERE